MHWLNTYLVWELMHWCSSKTEGYMKSKCYAPRFATSKKFNENFSFYQMIVPVSTILNLSLYCYTIISPLWLLNFFGELDFFSSFTANQFWYEGKKTLVNRKVHGKYTFKYIDFEFVMHSLSPFFGLLLIMDSFSGCLIQFKSPTYCRQRNQSHST